MLNVLLRPAICPKCISRLSNQLPRLLPKSSFHTTSVYSVQVGYGPSVHRPKQKKHIYKEWMLPWKNQQELSAHMLQNIVYENDSIIVLNKPPLLPMHAFKYKEMMSQNVAPPEDAGLSVQSCFRDIIEDRGLQEPLSIVFSQHRLYSGLVVLAKDEKTAAVLKRHFQTTHTQKMFNQDFLAITMGCPNPPNNECEAFTIVRKRSNDQTKSVKNENASNKSREKGLVAKPNIKYETLDYNRATSSALVKIQPTAMKWDAMQLFLVHKLAPVLGDYDYSARVARMAGVPILLKGSMKDGHQPLPQEIKRALKINSPDDTYIPLHLHCTSMQVPDLEWRGKKRYLTLHAPLPTVFAWTVDALGLKMPAENQLKGKTSQHKKNREESATSSPEGISNTPRTVNVELG